MKTVFERAAHKKNSPMTGMLIVLASICVFLGFLAAVTAIVHIIAM